MNILTAANRRAKSPFIRTWITVVSIMVVFPASTPALAITGTDRKAVYGSSEFYDPIDVTRCAAPTGSIDGGAPGTLGTTNATTKEAAEQRQKAIWDYLINRGMPSYQVAGVMGNMQVESANTWNPSIVEGVTYADSPPTYAPRSQSQPPGYGIVQWTPGTKILAPMATLGGKPNDLLSQLNLLWDQLTNPASGLSEIKAGNSLRATTNVTDATNVFGKQYERYAGALQPGRVLQAKAILLKFSSGYNGGGPAAAPAVSAAGDTSNACTSTPGTSVTTDGWAFPLSTTKKIILGGARNGSNQLAVWCYKAATNCHHDYKAADIHAPTGTLVTAISDGTVYVKNTNTLTIKSANPNSATQYIFFYQHLRAGSIRVGPPGSAVTAGQVVAEVGTIKEAFNSAPHLHIDAQASPPTLRRQNCKGAACIQYPFIDIQAILVKAYEGIPE